MTCILRNLMVLKTIIYSYFLIFLVQLCFHNYFISFIDYVQVTLVYKIQDAQRIFLKHSNIK